MAEINENKKTVTEESLDDVAGGRKPGGFHCSPYKTTWLICSACGVEKEWMGDYRNYVGNCPNPSCGGINTFHANPTYSR